MSLKKNFNYYVNQSLNRGIINMRVIALGRTKLLYDSIRFLHEQGLEIVLIGTCQESPEYNITASDFEQLADNIGADFFCDTHINTEERIHQIKTLKPDIAISVNWLGLIGQEIIECFPNGILNCHAGDLPRYRGNAVANWAIINGESEIVLSVHKMDLGLDTGDIILQKKFSIDENTKIGELYRLFEENIPKMFYKSVTGLKDGSLIQKPQEKDPLKALRCYPRIPSDSCLNWSESARYLNKIIRASSEPFSGAYTYLNGEKITILSSHVELFETPSLYVPGQVLWKRKHTGEVGMATGDGVLVIEKIRDESGYECNPTDIIKSLRTRLGMNLENEIYLLMKKVSYLEELIKKDK